MLSDLISSVQERIRIELDREVNQLEKVYFSVKYPNQEMRYLSKPINNSVLLNIIKMTLKSS